jgi:hypothetical protein
MPAFFDHRPLGMELAEFVHLLPPAHRRSLPAHSCHHDVPFSTLAIFGHLGNRLLNQYSYSGHPAVTGGVATLSGDGEGLIKTPHPEDIECSSEISIARPGGISD